VTSGSLQRYVAVFCVFRVSTTLLPPQVVKPPCESSSWISGFFGFRDSPPVPPLFCTLIRLRLSNKETHLHFTPVFDPLVHSVYEIGIGGNGCSPSLRVFYLFQYIYPPSPHPNTPKIYSSGLVSGGHAGIFRLTPPPLTLVPH